MRLPVFLLILFFVFSKNIQAGAPNTAFKIDSAKSKFINFKSNNHITPLTKSNKNLKWINDYKTFRFAVQGGFSYLVAPVSEFVPKDLVQHVKKLKTGMHYGIDIGLLPFEQIGFGAKFINFYTKNSNDIRTDKIRIRYFGPVIMNRFFSHDKNSLVLVSISGGYMAYKNDIKTYSESLTVKGNTFGCNLGVCYDYLFTPNISLGGGVSFTYGRLKKYDAYWTPSAKIVMLQSNKLENISNVDASIGLRVYF